MTERERSCSWWQSIQRHRSERTQEVVSVRRHLGLRRHTAAAYALFSIDALITQRNMKTTADSDAVMIIGTMRSPGRLAPSNDAYCDPALKQARLAKLRARVSVRGDLVR